MGKEEFKNPHPELPVREPILKLGKMITDRVPIKLGFEKLTADSPEYWGLAPICTDEQANIALKMGVRKPKTLKQMVQITGMDEKELEKQLEQMSFNGLLEYNWENPQHEKQYVLPMFVPGSAEFTNMNSTVLEEHPEMGRFFERMSRLPLEKITPMVPPGGAGIGMHVIPVEKAIDMNNEAISLEKISYWLDKYDGKYAASPCSCRKSRKTYDEGCADDPEDWCIAVGDMADYVVETGKGGHYITKEEALEIFKKAEDNGFVHQITNIDGQDKIFAICNCNVNVCYALRTSQLFNTPNMSRSAYVAKVTKENCVACGKCVEYCPAGAVKLGQKLCTKDGSEIKYPKMPLPSEQKWGPHMWTEDYRDKNRINCYDTGTAPCKTACPAHIAVQGYLKMAAQGRYKDALALIKKDNPFPAVCGHVCNRRCEDACTRGTIDEPIAIDEIKKFIAAKEINEKDRYIPKTVNHEGKQFEEKIAIVGAGPAGMSAAYYLRCKGYPVTVFEREDKAGGMLLNGIPSFRLEKDVIAAEIEVLKTMGVEFRFGIDVGSDVTIQQLRDEGYKAFYIAIGARGGRMAGVPGEDAKGVMSGIEFLNKVNKDEEHMKLSGKTVVIGGGNVAMDVARTALRAGSDDVSMYCLESRDEMPAAKDEIEEALEENISINNGWGPKEIITENGRVKAVVLKKCTSVFNAEKRFAPVYDENDTITIECDNVLLSIGQQIIWGNLLAGTKVELNKNGTAKADPVTYQTAEPDVFVGGDVYTGPRFAIDAIAAGKEGCVSIHRFVHKGHSLTLARDLRHFIELDKNNLDIEEYDNAKRQRPGRKSGDAASTYRDLREIFTEEQLKTEASRCLGCGATVVDPNKCIGCGLCTTKCEFDAIHLSRDLPDASRMTKSEDKLKKILPYMIKREIKIKFNKDKK